jgi:hypothetical protein
VQDGYVSDRDFGEEAMNPIVTTIVATALGWSSAPVSAPYGFVEQDAVIVASPYLTVEFVGFAPYAPYSLACQHSEQTVAVRSADGGTRQITITRC